ncbi:MAG: BrnT family toxin [Patescibacteria group bacterium]
MDDLFKDIEGFEWDKWNQEKSWLKHNIIYKEAEEVFDDDYSYISEDIKHSQIEKRYQVLGVTKINNKLVVVFTIRKTKIRIISARVMNKKEKIKYEYEKQKIIANS